MLKSMQAIEAIRILDGATRKRRGRGNVWQNKRKTFRDIKWDYLGMQTATRISNALTRSGIAHRKITVPGYGPWSDGTHWQIRIAVPLDFSLGAARRIRGKHPLKKTKKLSAKARFASDKRAALKTLASLKFNQPGAPRMLRGVASALYYAEGLET